MTAEWAGHPVGALAWTAGCGAVSAYLIRSRPLGRKINSRACCYCGIRGRALTRAQHNIYSDGATHTHTHTWRHMYLHLFGGDKNSEMCDRYTAAEGKAGAGVKPALEQHNLVVQSTKHTQMNQPCVCRSLFCICRFIVYVRVARASSAAQFICLHKKKSGGTCDLLALSSAL